MSEPVDHKDKALIVEDYRPALARAVEWLGERYLPAKPINAEIQRKQKRNPRSSALVETPAVGPEGKPAKTT
jgi:hypothetical protein